MKEEIRREAISWAIEELKKEIKSFEIIGYDDEIEGLIVASDCFDGYISKEYLLLFDGICDEIINGIESDIVIDFEPDFVKEVRERIKDVNEFRHVINEYIDVWSKFDSMVGEYMYEELYGED